MTYSPDVIAGPWPEPYGLPRGTCPRCGSADVRHLVAGLPGTPEWTGGSTPEWVDGVGCLLPLHNRECDGCSLEWTDDGGEL